MDPLSLIVGALIAAVAYTAGRSRGVHAGRKRAHIESGAPPVAVCGCGHAPGMHVDKSGKCKFEEWDSWDKRMDPCPCQGYDGPEPLPTYYAPPITDS